VTAFPPTEGRTYDYAMAYIKRGWSIIPVAAGGSKIPLVKWKPHQSRRASEAELIGWLQRWPDMNLGVVTGEISGIVVLDLDGPEAVTACKAAGLAFPLTLCQRTPRGGWHAVYARTEPVKTAAGLLPRVDTRGEGGYIMVAPSTRPDGAYRWLTTPPAPLAPAPAPDWLASFARKAAARAEAERGADGTPVTDAWVTRALDGAAEGGRNDTAARLAGYFRAKDIPEDIVAAVLRPYAQQCSPPMDADELFDVIRSVQRYPVAAKPKRDSARAVFGLDEKD
jgi:hypothetical protein